ncbi:hypothetical protein [Erythrobacter litoralis]|uniref:Uncharacterized protein n=1 Tax=Erythrobacter litoralis (strain HTCC2594) TaxID=314225 RepID=Q2N621_ERYLH|nr:hypothetical protein [Erythrobacter litoralis]ABC64870.1 hypothetical protein ELI_13890 [Erythrobacter litoralis HTCC2594]
MEPLQIVGSLVAILALAGLAMWLKLGGSPRIDSEETARLAADEAVDGFAAIRFGIDTDGRGALLEDGAGRILLLKPHGNQFAGRVLGPTAKAHMQSGVLTVDSGERRFGTITLALDDGAYWESAINRLKAISNA